jgi:hypothetical protein
VSIRVNPPANATGTQLRTTSWVEFGAGPVQREAIFSTKPCDFTNASALKNSLGAVFKSLDQNRFSFVYKIGSAGTTSAGLTAGGSYYINVRNKNSAGQDTCGYGDCGCAARSRTDRSFRHNDRPLRAGRFFFGVRTR